jgi:FkbM family methyltransferase
MACDSAENDGGSVMGVLNREKAVMDTADAAFDATALATSPRVRPDGGYLPPMISYAQNFEDVMLRRALQDIDRGFYVDIGAADPDVDSVTRWFYEQGWRGINVEPDPRYFQRLEERRPEDRNLRCVIGAANKNVIFNIAARVGWSTGSAERSAEITNLRGVATRPILVPAITLDQLLVQCCGREIDFLKIDAEGMEDEILGSASFAVQRPRIIVVEATLLDSQLPSHQRWEPKLLDKGYKFAWFDGLNRFYVRREDQWRLELFKIPPCIFDNFFSVTLRARTAETAEKIKAEFEPLRRDFEAQIGELRSALAQRENDNRGLKESLAQRENDCQRVRQRLVRMEISRRRLLENLRKTEEENQRFRDIINEHDDNFEELERHCQELELGCAQRDEAIGRLAAERDKAAAQSLRWFAAAIPDEGEGLRARRQYPLQALLYRSRIGRWLALGLRRRRRILMAAAKRARDRGNWALAARYYRDILDLAADRPGLWVQFGHALKEAGNFAAAEKAYRTSLGLDARIADTHLQLGHVLKLQGRIAEAVEAYRRSLSLAPGSADAINELRALDALPPGGEYAGHAVGAAA